MSVSLAQLAHVSRIVEERDEVTIAEFAELANISRPHAGEVLNTAASRGLVEREVPVQKFGEGRKPYVYRKSAAPAPQAEEETAPEPGYKQGPDSEGLVFHGNSTALRVARYVATLKPGAKFTVNAIMDQFARTNERPTRESVVQGVNRLVKQGYVVRTDKMRHYADGRRPVPYFAVAKAVVINGDSAPKPRTRKAKVQPEPVLGVAASITALLDQRGDLEQELYEREEAVRNTLATLESVNQEINAIRALLG